MQKCLICNEKFKEKPDLYDHYEDEHSSEFKKGMTGAQMHFFKIHGRITGKCIVCGKPTTWNDSTNLPNRFCDNPKCREKYRQIFVDRMKKKYGKEHLLNDPEVQKKMLFSRKISGEYKWSDGAMKQYVGTYELDFLRFLDKFYGFKSSDVMTPAPQIIEYQYQGKTHFYIPDVYIASLNLVIEIKDGGSNPNTHPKIMAVDKIKEELKDKAILKANVNYIKVVDKRYGAFVNYLNNMKMEEMKLSDSKNKTKELPDSLSESFLAEKTIAAMDNYLIIPNISFSYTDSENVNDRTMSNLSLLLPGKNVIVSFDNNTDNLHNVPIIKTSNFNKINLELDPDVRAYKLEKNGSDLYNFIHGGYIFDPTDFDVKAAHKLLSKFYNYDEMKFLDIYDLIYRSGKFKHVYSGKLKDLITNINNIEELNARKTLTEYYNMKNNLIFNENLNNNLNMGDEVGEEDLTEVTIDKNKINEIKKGIKLTNESKGYMKLIENSYKHTQIGIIREQIINNNKLEENSKLNLLKLCKIHESSLDIINKDEMDITILPIKIKETLPAVTLNKFNAQSNDLFNRYENLIKFGTFTDLNDQREGIEYLRSMRLGADQVSQNSTSNRLNENSMYKYYLGIADM